MIDAARRSIFCCLAWAVASASLPAEPSLAIQGYDPVAYFTLERATPGDARFEVRWDEHRWHFANARHRDLFKADPVRYAPQFTNYCAVALARGEVKAANPEYWLISDGRLYLFGKSEGPLLFRNALPASLENAREGLKRVAPEKSPRNPTR
jgi:hypothetical protein